MFITAAELESLPHKKAKYDLAIEDPDLYQDPEMKVQQIIGWISFQLEKNMILVQGQAQVKTGLICDRTLEPFDTVLDFEFCEGLGIAQEWSFAPEQEISQDDYSQYFRPYDKIDILELLREYIILNLPSKKLKDENCYNEHLVKLTQEFEDNAKKNSPWADIRDQVASWEEEKPKKEDLN